MLPIRTDPERLVPPAAMIAEIGAEVTNRQQVHAAVLTACMVEALRYGEFWQVHPMPGGFALVRTG